jgi:hypothetical protein
MNPRRMILYWNIGLCFLVGVALIILPLVLVPQPGGHPDPSLRIFATILGLIAIVTSVTILVIQMLRKRHH